MAHSAGNSLLALLLVSLLPFSHSSSSAVICTDFPQKIQIQLNLSSNLAVGENCSCECSELRQVRCLGSAHKVTDHLPERNLVLVGAGFLHFCGISFNTSSECWGNTKGERRQGESTSVQLGTDHGCAIRSNAIAFCCGENGFSLLESLRTQCFVAIEADRRIFYGTEKSNCLTLCWRNEAFDSDPVMFNHVVTGSCRRRHDNASCSLRFMICQTGDLNWANHRASQPPLPPPPPLPPGKKWSSKMVTFVVVGCVGSSLLLVLFIYLFLQYIKNRAETGIHDYHCLEEGGEASDHSHLEKFSLEVLLKATNNFSEELKIGNFGSVYHATLDDGHRVTVKRVESSASLTHNSAFLNEVNISSRLNHHNIVRLLGYCEHPDELLLIYKHMDNGTLYDHLHKLQSPFLMSWPNRIKVALDVATGIEYFHEYAEPCVVHRDIKPSNILLDAMWTAKVSGFGVSLVGPLNDESHLSLRVAGTIGYVDPEYYRLQRLTKKIDVYSFGIVLLELLSGCMAIHKDENGKPRNIVDFVVPYIVNDEIHRVLDGAMPPPTPFEMVAVAYVGYLAADCVSLEGGGRPSMFEVVDCLDRAWGACLAPIVLHSSCQLLKVVK